MTVEGNYYCDRETRMCYVNTDQIVVLLTVTKWRNLIVILILERGL